MMTGAMLEAAQSGMLLLIDGFIATSAFLVAFRKHPEILDYAVFAHQSDEQGHRRMLEFLRAEPLLKLGMRLGEGTGAALALPLAQSAGAFLAAVAGELIQIQCGLLLPTNQLLDAITRLACV